MPTAHVKSPRRKTAKPAKRKGGRAAPPSRLRLWSRLASAAAAAAFVALCVAGNFYVHHPPAWLDAHRSPLTAPLEFFGNRTAFFTDALGWTGHDAVYEFDAPPPSGQVFFAGAPRRVGAPAPADIVTLERGDFAIGWSPSLRHPVWAAYHVPRAARFEGGKRPSFQKDLSVSDSPSPSDYANSGYDRGHMVPNRAIVTRFGPDQQRKTFRMTNIAPQKPGLNRGPWRELEQRIADLWTARYGEIWVIVGALSDASPHKRTRLGASSIDVPSRYYMIAVAQDADGVRALAVLLDQNARRDDFPVHGIVTLDELERATGLDFFPDMPKFLKKPLSSDRPTRLWPCRFVDILKLILIRFT